MKMGEIISSHPQAFGAPYPEDKSSLVKWGHLTICDTSDRGNHGR